MLFCQIATNLEFSRQIFQEYRDIKFHESPCSGSRFCSWWTEGRTDVKRLTVAFSNFANRPKKLLSIISIYLYAKFLQQFYFNINICRNLTILVQYICASPVRHFNYVPPLTYYCMGSYSWVRFSFLLFTVLMLGFYPVLYLLCIMFWVSALLECSEVNDSLSINRKLTGCIVERGSYAPLH